MPEADADQYAAFTMLLDEPTVQPGLGFDRYAAVLAETIVHSRAEFAIGIFGTWGSGKTTLMRAIERNLTGRDNVVPVWFAAWRYEKDPNLLLPLLDVMSEALAEEGRADKDWARNAAVEIARAGQAFLAAVQISAGFAGVQANFSPGDMAKAMKDSREPPAPLSYYHRGFRLLRAAIRQLSANGTRRVVIFIDDLDRCLPPNALDVLESMKLFFDVEGCVFVVGLDQQIAERAVALKYATDLQAGEPGAGAAEVTKAPSRQGILASDYLKKLFQVSFALPQMKTQQLPDYLDTIERTSGFSPPQRRDFASNVRPHFAVLQGESVLNLREIKRLINLYTLQVKMLAPRLGASLDAAVVLALLCMSYRQDWQVLYQRICADPEYVQAALREAISGKDWPKSVWLAGDEYALPADFVEYLQALAAPILHDNELPAYVSTAESTSSSDLWVLEARTTISRLRRTADGLRTGDIALADAAAQISSDVGRIYGLVRARREVYGRFGLIREQLAAAAAELMKITQELVDAVDAGAANFLMRWNTEAVPQIDALDAGLLDWRQHIGLGG